MASAQRRDQIMVTLNREVNMKRIILTTCGTSLLQTSCWDLDGCDGKKLNAKSLSDLDDDNKKEYELTCRNVLTANINLPENISASFDRSSWDDLGYLSDLPAELASLRAIQECYKSREEHLGNGDKVILLHSDNKDGKYCEKVIYNVLNDNDLLNGVEIDECEVKGLDPTDCEKFGDALSNIWHKSFQQFKDDDDIQYIFNLTGGYKGIAITLGAFAYFKGLDTHIFYLYEETGYKQISIMYFDPNTDTPGVSMLKIGYFDLSTGKSKTPTHIPDEHFD